MRQVSLVLIAAVLLSGCSIKLVYNNLDRFVRWQVSDYIDLDDNQRRYLNQEVKRLLAWHRSNHLPLYSDFMLKLPVQLSDTVTPSTLRGVFEQFTVWADEVESEGMPLAVNLLASLTDEQIAELPARLEESNRDIEKDEIDLDLEEAQAAWSKDLEDTMRRFTGRLNDEQVALIERRATAYQPERALWADYRRRWQEALLDLLEDRQSTGFDVRFRTLVAARETYYGEEYTRISGENEQLSLEVVAAVLSNLSEKQSRRFAESLTELGEDFAELAGQT